MKNEEKTIVSQYSAESDTQVENSVAGKNNTEKSKGNDIAGNIGAAAVGAAAGVAGTTMFVDDAKATVLPDPENPTEETSEEQPASDAQSASGAVTASAKHTASHTTSHSTPVSHQEPATNHSVEVVNVTKADVDGDGQADDVALLNVDGENMIIADLDHDGEADILMRDANGNEQLDKEDVVDIKSNHIAMPGHSDATQTSQQNEDNDDVDVRVLHVGQADLNNDGVTENIAVVDIEGDEVLLVDIDKDKKADVLIHNENGTNQMYDVSDANIEMPTMSDGDMFMAGAESEPDYTNDADTDLFDA